MPIATDLVSWLKDYFQELVRWQYFWPVIIAIVLLLVILRKLQKKRAIINLSTHPDGRVSVVSSALIHLIENTCNDVAPNSKPRVHISQNKNLLNIKIKIRVFSDQHIESTTSKIQKQVNYVLQNTLGLENIGSVNILIAGFSKSQNKTISENSPEYPQDDI